MTHRILSLLLLMAAGMQLSAQTISDMGMARDWCDRTMLHRVEGIWEFVEDQTLVLVKRSPGNDNEYDLVVIDTPDTRLNPGDKIGVLSISPSPTKFGLKLYTSKKTGSFVNPMKCLAQLNETDNALLVKSPKIKFSLASRWFLPSFWRAIRIRINNPAEQLPEGLVRIYPTPARQQPDYL